jgi:hypothetical protein
MGVSRGTAELEGAKSAGRARKRAVGKVIVI